MKNKFALKIITTSLIAANIVSPIFLSSCSEQKYINCETKTKTTDWFGCTFYKFNLVDNIPTDCTIKAEICNISSNKFFVECLGISKPRGETNDFVAVVRIKTNGTAIVDGDNVKFDIKFTCVNNKDDQTIWTTTINGFSATYDSKPRLEDSDYDGLYDVVDPWPNDNKYDGYMEDFSKQPVDLTIDYRTLIESNPNTYDVNLAKIGMALSMDVNNYNALTLNQQMFDGQDRLSKLMGCSDWERYDLQKEDWEFDKNDTETCTISHHNMLYKTATDSEPKLYKIVFVTFRGTNGGCEWISNMDMGINNDSYYKKIVKDGTSDQHPDWLIDNKDQYHHKGFAVAKNRMVKHLEDETEGYFKRANIDLKNDNVILFITGHSRGGSIANLLTAHYLDLFGSEGYQGIKKIFGYCFATPNVTTDSEINADKYKPIHCVINDGDIVGMFPFTTWEFKKYGQKHVCTIGPKPENKKQWEENWSKLDNNEPHTFFYSENLLENVETLPADKREDLYNLDGTLNEKQTFETNDGPFDTEVDANQKIDDYKATLTELNMDQYFKLEAIDDEGEWNIQCTNCMGILYPIVDNLINPDVPFKKIVGILPLISNLFGYLIPLATEIIKGAIETGDGYYPIGLFAYNHEEPTYFFATDHLNQ